MNKKYLRCKLLQKVLARIPGQRSLQIALLCTFVFLNVQNSYCQHERVNLKLRNSSVKELFDEIQKQTKLSFIFNPEQTAKMGSISINANGESVDNVLKKVFANTGLTYSFNDNMIVISTQKQQQQQTVQEVLINGVVVNEAGESMPGVTILLKGTNIGHVTDHEGKFKFKVPANKDIRLIFSFIGMKTQEVAFNNQKSLKVVMTTDVKEMNEVVVTGYFNFNKGNFTGDAVSFKGEQLKEVNPVNALAALSVLDPSFKMVENLVDGSNPNTIPQFQVRGGASMPNMKNEYKGDPNMPTFIMDGFEVSAEKVFDLDPNRIESITLLKDAAATAIYGSRAANGVVVIQTKMPGEGNLSVTYNLDLSFNLPDLRDYHLLNAQQKLQLEKDAGFYLASTPSALEERQDQYNRKLELVKKGYDTYWLDKPLHNAVGHKHSLYVEGGEKSIRYALDLAYEDAPGVMKESSRNRIGVGMMLQYVMKNITFKNYITYNKVSAENSPYGNFSDYARANPYYAYEDENGDYLYVLERDKRGAFGNVPNPLYNSQLNIIDENSYTSFTDNFNLDWNITDALRLKANIGLTQKKNEATLFKPAKHTDFAGYTGDNAMRKGSYKATEGKEFSYDANVVLSYFKQFDNHVINGNAALNVQNTSGDEYSVSMEGFPDESLDYLIFGSQYHEYQHPTGGDHISRLIGFVGNLNYSFKERYLLDMSVRMDASSKFGKDSRWAPFGSVGMGWNIHNENFIKDNAEWIDRLKIRASIGWVGSQSFDPFQAVSKYEYNVTERYRYAIGAYMKGLANNSLKWQKTVQHNVGLDIELFKRRLNISANMYYNLSKSLLSDLTLPPSLGFNTYTENIGERENKGFDLKLRATLWRNKDGYVNISANIAHNKDKLKKISNGLKAWNDSQDKEISNAPRIRFIEGESTRTIWGVPSMGINPANGREIFVNRNGQRTEVWDARDQRPLGCMEPKIDGNLSLNAGYKGLSLSVYMNYRIGGETYNNTLVSRVENADKRYNCDIRVLEDRWKKPGDVTFFKDIRNNETTQATSRFVEKYNYLKMSSMTLSYDFNRDWLKRYHLEGLKLSFSMNDVFYWSTVKQERGLNYPFARNFRTSLRITF